MREVIKKESVTNKCWGLKVNDGWLVDSEGIILHFACPAVARAQKELFDTHCEDLFDDEIVIEEIK